VIAPDHQQVLSERHSSAAGSCVRSRTFIPSPAVGNVDVRLSPSGNHKNSKSTGPVVVDASGEIFGDVPNIAARAQALAEPGAVVVTALAVSFQ
jgi:dienelactone hydrolase